MGRNKFVESSIQINECSFKNYIKNPKPNSNQVSTMTKSILQSDNISNTSYASVLQSKTKVVTKNAVHQKIQRQINFFHIYI